MEDKLRQFIDEHRDELDNHEPPARMWYAINNELHRRKKRRIIRMGIAAGLVFLVGIAASWLLVPALQQSATEQVSTQKKPRTINDAEVYYASLVHTQQQQLSNYCGDYQDLCRDFRNEIDTLNLLYVQLKTEYTTSYNNEAVLNAMIENLKEQVSLLSMQLEIIKDIKQQKNKKRNLL